MSDVTVAPSGDSAPPAAPENEVAIDTNPVSSPQPIGSQAPEKSPREARMAAIQEAYDRAEKGSKEGLKAARPPAKAAEAKPGHNKPPEETPKEKFDLKKPPSASQGEQPRDRGRFAPRDATNDPQIVATNGAQNVAFGEQKGATQGSYKQLPSNAPYAEPPPRMAEHARRDWAAAPESVRGEVHRMEQEFAKAYQYYKGAHEAFQPIARFHKMAQDHGVTLEQALVNYTGMEMKLRADPIAGLDVIVNNLGLKAPNGQKLGLRDIAYHVLNQSPEQIKALQISNAQSAASQQIGALHQEIAGLKNTLQQWQTAQQFTYTRSQVDQFAESHPRFDELGTVIEQELKSGYDLETAYRRAELLFPATHAAQTRTPSAQTRPADKSISGSPGVTGSNPAHRRPEKQVGRREALEYAFNHANGGL